MSIRLLICEDRKLVREYLQELISPWQGIEIVGQAASEEEAVWLARVVRPDIVLMDVVLSGARGSGITATRTIRAENPAVKVLAVSMHDDVHYVEAMLQAGALGYVLKSNLFEDLEKAIRATARGERFFSEGVRQHAENYLSRVSEAQMGDREDKETEQRI